MQKSTKEKELIDSVKIYLCSMRHSTLWTVTGIDFTLHSLCKTKLCVKQFFYKTF